jgi:exosortase/archaeosortase family protein
MTLFCRPAATLSSWFLRVSFTDTARGLHLLHERYDIFVVASCSGFDFFALLLAVFFAMAFRFPGSRRWHWAAWGMAAYAITITANTARIVSSVYARLFSDALPFNFPADLTHFAVGTAIFATVLVASCQIIRLIYAPRTRRPLRS